MFSFTACAQPTPVSIPAAFKETPIPDSQSDEWYALNHSEHEFQVEIVDGKLVVEEDPYSDRCELALPNGKLVGINRGEWGGMLTFEPADTTQKVVEIKRGNIKYIFRFEDKIYFIEGLAHLSISRGAIYELDITNNTFTYKSVVDFDDAPEAYAIYGDKILVATYENFYVVEKFRKKEIFKETFWGSLYPNSIAVVDESTVFLGMRGGIAQIDPKTKAIKFYRYAP